MRCSKSSEETTFWWALALDVGAVTFRLLFFYLFYYFLLREHLRLRIAHDRARFLAQLSLGAALAVLITRALTPSFRVELLHIILHISAETTLPSEQTVLQNLRHGRS